MGLALAILVQVKGIVESTIGHLSAHKDEPARLKNARGTLTGVNKMANQMPELLEKNKDQIPEDLFGMLLENLKSVEKKLLRTNKASQKLGSFGSRNRRAIPDVARKGLQFIRSKSRADMMKSIEDGTYQVSILLHLMLTDICRFSNNKNTKVGKRKSQPVHIAGMFMKDQEPRNKIVRQSAPGASPNMVFNPCASTHKGTYGWTTLSGMWKTELSKVPFHTSNFNFVSSNGRCSMAQVIPLHTFLKNPASAALKVSARFRASPRCPSSFSITAVLYDNRFDKLTHFSSGGLQAPTKFWELAKHLFKPQKGAAFLVVDVSGNTNRRSEGNFGPKVTDITVKVLFNKSTMGESELVRPGAFEKEENQYCKDMHKVLSIYQDQKPAMLD